MTAWGTIPTTNTEIYKVNFASFLAADQVITNFSPTFDTIFSTPVIIGRFYLIRGLVFLNCTAGGYSVFLGRGLPTDANTGGMVRKSEAGVISFAAGDASFSNGNLTVSASGVHNNVAISWITHYKPGSSTNLLLEAARLTSSGTDLTIKKGSCLMIEDIT